MNGYSTRWLRRLLIYKSRPGRRMVGGNFNNVAKSGRRFTVQKDGNLLGLHKDELS